MYLLPNRIANRTFPTVPLMEGKIVILGPRDQSAPVSIFQPFRGDAWVTLAVVLVLISLLSVLKFCLSTKDHSFYNYVRSLFGDDVSDSIIPSQNGGEQSSEEQEWWRGLQEKSRLVNKVAGTTTGLALAAFLTISILCYEIAIVNFAFVQQAKHLGKDIQNLTPRELSKYIVMANAAHETVWRKLVDPEGRYAEVPVPWRRCGKANECFRKLLDKNHPAIYYVTQNINVRYQLRQRNLCNTHTVYNTKRPIFPSYWGWYFGANVPVDVRVRVNRAITTLSLEGKLRQIITHVGEISDELDCGEPNRSIGVETVGPMIALVVGSFVLVACIALLKGWVIQRLAGRGYKGPAVAKDS